MAQAGDPDAPAKAPPNPAEPASGLEVGHIIGKRYVIEQRISEGTFGEVFRASDREIRSHHVAVKLLRRPSASETERTDALRELMLIASVSHPSVVQFKDYGWHDDRLWFAMPWYDGQPLDSVLGGGENAVTMSRAQAKPIFVRIAQGLNAMHAVGIHHHDIKPENIFLAEIAGFPGGLPVLLDLGIATKRGENPKGLTVDYASPETAAAMLGTRSEPIGGATDVYSLALVLRNALDPSVIEPDSAQDPLPRLHERATKPVALPAKRDLHYLAPHFQRWLSLDPELRPTAGEFAEELRVLTAPEEKREARVKLLKRAGPIAAVAALLIAGLVSQLQKQKSALDAQGQELQEERGAAEQLRNQSAGQLAEIERQAQTLGNERQQLEQAIAIGRRLDDQLAAAGKRNEQLYRRTVKLTAERDGLSTDNASLNKERDGLLLDKRTLTVERDVLAQEKRALTAERDALSQDKRTLTAERDALSQDKRMLTAERDALSQDKRTLSAERDALSQDKATLTAERDGLAQDKRGLASERDALAQDKRALVSERDTLTQDKRALSAENASLKQQLEDLRSRPQLPAESAPNGPSGQATGSESASAP